MVTLTNTLILTHHPFYDGSKNLPTFAGQTSFNNIIITYAICTITTYDIFMKTTHNYLKF
jgi:hypothetical protein